MSTQHDLSSLYVKFQECPTGKKLVEHFTELSAFPEFNAALSDNEIKIAILTSDLDSPFLKIRDRETMLRSIFDSLSIKIDSKEEKVFFEEVLQYKHTRVIGCWIRYIQMLHDTDYTDWLLSQQTYNFLLFESQKPKETTETDDKYLDRRIKIQNNLKKFGAEMKVIEAKIFPDSKAAREASMHENKKIVTYAEKYSEDYTHI